MAASLPNSSNPSWNIPKGEDGDAVTSPYHHSAQTQRHPVFPLRSFSSLGGGDAPSTLLTNMPRVRSQLFTISTTRAVMTAHSQMHVNYTSTTSSEEVDHTVKHFSSSSSSVSVDSDIDELAITELKPLNTDQTAAASNVYSSIPHKSTKDWETSCKVERLGILSRSKRCIHGSFDDLFAQRNRTNGNSQSISNNRRKSAPAASNSSSRGLMIQAANDLLMEENKYLVHTIQNLRKKLLLSKIATRFTLEAVKRRGKVIKAVEAQKREKERQCAARLILHSLLLNSWRNTRRELDIRLGDNAELKKSVENFALQVQVLRHVQNGERQKAQEKANIIRNLSEELNMIKEENDMMRKEMEKMENELNSLQASSQNLIDENKIISDEITKMIDMKNRLSQSLEWERVRSEQYSKENATMKENLKNLETQLNEAIEQKAHWQERARCSESETWELQLHLESKNSSIQELTSACEALRAEKLKLTELKSQLKSELERTTLELQKLTEKSDELVRTYEQIKAERDTKVNKIQEMEMSLLTTKKEFSEIEKELLSYKLQNVRKRREWGNALYFIVSPMEAVKRKLL